MHMVQCHMVCVVCGVRYVRFMCDIVCMCVMCHTCPPRSHILMVTRPLVTFFMLNPTCSQYGGGAMTRGRLLRGCAAACARSAAPHCVRMCVHTPQGRSR